MASIVCFRRDLWAVAGLLWVVLGVAASAGAETISGLKPTEPQPEAARLKPGLAVQYTYAIMNHVDEMKGRQFEPGSPILHLDWVMGTGRVLTSKAHEGVGAILTGFLQFEKPGVYGVNVTSNDGVRLEIGGRLIHEDPGVHSDTTSDRIDLKIDQPGWYPITITYFQKRHTATLVVRWIGPGEKGKLQPVAPRALAHIPQ
jgi:PA14 domain